MLFLKQNFQVIVRVICSITVLVMDYFVFVQPPTKFLLSFNLVNVCIPVCHAKVVTYRYSNSNVTLC